MSKLSLVLGLGQHAATVTPVVDDETDRPHAEQRIRIEFGGAALFIEKGDVPAFAAALLNAATK